MRCHHALNGVLSHVGKLITVDSQLVGVFAVIPFARLVLVHSRHAVPQRLIKGHVIDKVLVGDVLHDTARHHVGVVVFVNLD